MSLATVLKTVLPFASAFGIALLVGCGAAPDGTPAETTSEALKCTTCGGENGDPSGGSMILPACNPSTECCVGGGRALNTTSCERALLSNNCDNFANAFEQAGVNMYWFNVTCPDTQQVRNLAASGGVCSVYPYQAEINPPSNCLSPAPLGRLNFAWDPNCSSGNCVVLR